MEMKLAEQVPWINIQEAYMPLDSQLSTDAGWWTATCYILSFNLKLELLFHGPLIVNLSKYVTPCT